MNQLTKQLMVCFTVIPSEKDFTLGKYSMFYPLVKNIVSGAGPIGDDGYLILWNKDELESLNDDYKTTTFLGNVLLIGSDGGDNAYGIYDNGDFFVVPFIGMDTSAMKYISTSFDEFIKYVSKCGL